MVCLLAGSCEYGNTVPLDLNLTLTSTYANANTFSLSSQPMLTSKGSMLSSKGNMLSSKGNTLSSKGNMLSCMILLAIEIDARMQSDCSHASSKVHASTNITLQA